MYKNEYDPHVACSSAESCSLRAASCTASLEYIAQLDQQHLLSARRQLHCMPASSTSPS
jgi:hypothetical protein